MLSLEPLGWRRSGLSSRGRVSKLHLRPSGPSWEWQGFRGVSPIQPPRARLHNGRKRGSALCPKRSADRRFLQPPWGQDPASPGAERQPGPAPSCPPRTPRPPGSGVTPAAARAR